MKQLPWIVVALLVGSVAWALAQDAPANEYSVGCSGAANCSGAAYSEVYVPVRTYRPTLWQRIRANRQARIAARQAPTFYVVPAAPTGCGG